MPTPHGKIIGDTPTPGHVEVPPRAAAAPGAPRQRPTRRRLLLVIAGMVLAILAGWGIAHRRPAGVGGAGPAGMTRGQSGPVPVVEGVVSTKDVPIYLDGLGTVQAFNTVTV